ncbi:MAG: hypothetical protein AAGJ79_02610 [Verrucomicrobiota bacterium]
MSASDQDMELDPLTFSWRRFRWNTRFLLFVILSVFAHAAFFWAFAVKYPEPSRTLPSTARLVVLDAGDPTTLDVLRQIEDRVAALDDSLRARTRLPEGIVEEVRFSPLFANRDPKLKSLPPLELPVQLPLLFPPGETYAPLLPRRRADHADQPQPEVIPPATLPIPQISIFGESLGERDLAHPVDWTGSDRLFETPEEGFASFYVGVDASGRVAHCLMSEGQQSPAARYLHRLIKSLNFVPAPESQRQWGWVELRW